MNPSWHLPALNPIPGSARMSYGAGPPGENRCPQIAGIEAVNRENRDRPDMAPVFPRTRKQGRPRVGAAMAAAKARALLVPIRE